MVVIVQREVPQENAFAAIFAGVEKQWWSPVRFFHLNKKECKTAATKKSSGNVADISTHKMRRLQAIAVSIVQCTVILITLTPQYEKG